MAAEAIARAPDLAAREPVEDPGPAVFLLQGVGDQYVGMAYGLYQRWEVFRDELDRCALLFQQHLQQDIREVLYPPDHEWLQSRQPAGYDLKAMVGRSGA